jgi:hypothetical protein
MLVQLLRAAVEVKYGDCCVSVLLALPAAAVISKQHAKELMLLAFEQIDRSGWGNEWTNTAAEHFAKLPAVQEFGADEVLQLMLAATQHGLDSGLMELCKLPAAQQLSSENLVELLSLVDMQKGMLWVNGRKAMYELPAASQLSSKQMTHFFG